MKFRSSLLAGVACVALAAACSSPDDEGPGPAPTGIPPLANAGAGGTSAVAPLTPGSGGTGGAPAAAGTGGTGAQATAGTGGTPGAGGTAAAPAGLGNDLTPNPDGFVLATTNGLGIQGAFFTAADTGGSTIAPAAFTGQVTAAGDICVSGSGAAIPPNPAGAATPLDTGDDFLYSQAWGAIVGLNLSQPNDPTTGAASVTPQAYNRAVPGKGTVSGFTFSLIPGPAGGAVPPTIPPAAAMRFKTTFPSAPGGTTAGMPEFCLPLTAVTPAAGLYTVSIAAQTAQCWLAGGMPFSNAQLLSLQLQIVTNTMTPVPFNFCISDLKAIVTP